MQFTTLTSLAIAVLGVSAGTVNKRNGEGVHLANCLQNSNLGPIPYSMVIYYADDADASRNVSRMIHCYLNTRYRYLQVQTCRRHDGPRQRHCIAQ